MRDIIISAATVGREDYREMIKGLEDSLYLWSGDVQIYKVMPEWCTPHAKIPYAFKYDMINKARQDGYERIVWMDSSMKLLKDISVLFDTVTAFHNLGHDLWPYINDTALDNLQMELKDAKQIWGGALFFDFGYELTRSIYKDIEIQIAMGSFNEDNTDRPGFKGHRHDQAVISAILDFYNIPLLPYGVLAGKNDVTSESYIQYG